MAEADIDAIIATADGDTTWGADMRGAFTTVQQRRVGLPYVSARYYEASGTLGQAWTDGNASGVANRWDMHAFSPDVDITIDQIGVEVVTGVASATVKITVYNSSTTTGLPTTLVHESAALAADTSATFAAGTVSITFEGGKVYWLGVRHSSTATVRGGTAATSRNLGLDGSTGTNRSIYGLQGTLTYATAAPSNPLAWTDAHTSNSTPRVRFRIA